MSDERDIQRASKPTTMDHPTFVVGSVYLNWYNKPATLLAAFPYTGKYPDWFTHVLRLSAPAAKQGWLDMAVHISDYQGDVPRKGGAR